ncbi:MAG: hypothetical protein EOO43_00755 [Flavobacterium sp.]|nr:MAG: hypothetical protein EOO43_00755 [Flavobacterium sp.]
MLLSCGQFVYKTNEAVRVYTNIARTDSIMINKGSYWIGGMNYYKKTDARELLFIDTSKLESKGIPFSRVRVDVVKLYTTKKQAVKLLETSGRATFNNRSVGAVLGPSLTNDIKYAEVYQGGKL